MRPHAARRQYTCHTPAGRDIRLPWGCYNGVAYHDRPWAEGVLGAQP